MKYGVTRKLHLGLEVVLATATSSDRQPHPQKQNGLISSASSSAQRASSALSTEATLRLLPAATARAVLSASFPALQQASDAVQRILAAALPAALEVADAFTLNAAGSISGIHRPARRRPSPCRDRRQEASVKSEAAAIAALIKCRAHSISAKPTATKKRAAVGLRRKFSESLKSTGLTKLNEDIVVPAAGWWTSPSSPPISASVTASP